MLILSHNFSLEEQVMFYIARKYRIVVLSIALLIELSWVRSSMAAVKANQLSISPFIGQYVFDSDLPYNDTTRTVIGIKLGYDLSTRWGLEVLNETHTIRGSEHANIYQDFIRLEGLYYFRPDKEWVPFVAAGLGVTNLDINTGKAGSNTVFDYGVGVKYFLADWVALRADLRHILVLDQPVLNDLEYHVGLNFFVPIRWKEKERDKDSDWDGVLDSQDQCPDTPLGIEVNSKGCPLQFDKDSDGDGVIEDLDLCPATPRGSKVDSNGCPLMLDKDSDGDGVIEDLDLCPATPRGSKVDPQGCPLMLDKDSDGDGVIDDLDLCPGTLNAIQVDATGCPPKEINITLEIEFDTGKADIRPQYTKEIDRFVEFLKENPDLIATIEGHTDSVGSAQDNLSLSQKRSKNVVDLLVRLGIDRERLKAVGYGESRPIVKEVTSGNRQKNRRIVVVVTKRK